MRVFSTALIAPVSLAQAQVEEPTDSKKPGIICGYTIKGHYYEVPPARVFVGARRRLMAEYAMLHCYPPFQEGILVKRGDSRCGGRYEDRER